MISSRVGRVLDSKRTAAALLLSLSALAGCDGENLFRTGTDGILPNDTRDPAVTIESPDSGQRIAVGDSVYMQIRATDDQGIARLDLVGFALSGSAELGTLTELPRFQPKSVELQGARPLVRDTVLIRYLLPTGDSIPADTVLLVAAVTDHSGNTSADTVRVAIGGPRIQIVAPTNGAQVRPGAQLLVRLAAADSANRLQSVRIRATGQLTADTILRFDPAVGSVDTLVALDVPTSASAGEVQLRATARNTQNDSTVSLPVGISLLAPATDTRAPTVRFRVAAPQRAEQDDSLSVTVTATDDVRVDRVGATLLAIHRLATGTDTLGVLPLSHQGDSATFRISLGDLGAPSAIDTSTVRIETTANAFDATGNCATASVPNTSLSEGCVLQADAVLGTRSGSRSELLMVRGATASTVGNNDRLADLTVDELGRRVFVTNFTRNRLEVLPFGGRAFTDSIVVGSEPWGVALGVSRDTLFVANSAGTNISVVPLAQLAEVESLRISPADIRLYAVEYEVETDSVDVVTIHDYSDRPQFIGQVSSGQLIYSTKPTSTREPGTIRIVDTSKDTRREFNRGSEIFINYAVTDIGRGIVVNALSAGLAQGRTITVCPRSALGGADPACVNGTASEVRDALLALESAGLSDTRLELGRDIESIALTDTTFVAVSRDNTSVAFGEGAIAPGRTFLFQDVDGELQGSSTETEDLIGNAAERVIGLALNGDGSLGAARGQRAYFFDDDLRLAGQAVVGFGAPTGGIALHPGDAAYPSGPSELRRAFVSAEDADGLPYIDVIDTFTFRSIQKVYIRDRVVGTLAAAQVQPNDPEFGSVAVRLFGITTRGLIEVELSEADLR